MKSSTQRILTRALVTLVLVGIRAHAQTDEFTVILLPDTQFYSESYPQIFNSQTQWIVDHRSDMNIQFVLGLGDIVNVGSDLTQWSNADIAVRTLDAQQIPYLLAIGNKDYEDLTKRVVTNFNAYFGPQRYSAYPWYKGSTSGGSYPQGSNENYYGVFDVNGNKFVAIMLEFMPREEALQWAESVLALPELAGAEVIVVTHSFVTTDNTRVDVCDSNYAVTGYRGEDMWSRFIAQHPNIVMVLNGHTPGVGRRKDVNGSNMLVNQLLSDYQSMVNGGNGYLRILRFKPSLNQIAVTTYSPYLNTFLTDSKNQFTITYHAAGGSTLTSIAGKVRVPRIGSTQDCKAIASATVSTGSTSATSDVSGNFTLSSLLPGAYQVTARAQNLNPITQSTTASGGYPARLEFFLAPDFGNITGVVKNSSGVVIRSATVQIVGGLVNFNKKATTSSTGKFTFSSVSAGTYSVTVSKTGYTTRTMSAEVSPNAVTNLTITLN